MSSPSRTRVFCLSYLSKPASNRPIYRVIARQKARKILELGIGAGTRAARMIEVAGSFSPLREIEFSGTDLFEARSAADGPGVTLKMAHRMLGSTGARIRLIPGDPFAALARSANSLGQIDLLIISARLDAQHLARAWFYVPRLLHDRTQVFLEGTLPGGQTCLRLVAREEIEALAAAAARGRAA